MVQKNQSIFHEGERGGGVEDSFVVVSVFFFSKLGV